MKKTEIATEVPVVTVITPTTGKKSLFNLIETITRQNVSVNHILLWDDKSDDSFKDKSPDFLDKKEYGDLYGYSVNNIVLKGKRTNGGATGSALRSVGLMAANTEWVTFADDDVMWEDGHLISLLQKTEDKNWGFCKRKIWMETEDMYELIGIDEFESVGEKAKTDYKMVDNNCMIFRRKFGAAAACLYRETKEYNDDRLMYAFLMEYAGEPGITDLATINQVCPNKLIQFFKQNCTKIKS